MLSDLQWPSLEHCRQFTRLKLLYHNCTSGISTQITRIFFQHLLSYTPPPSSLFLDSFYHVDVITTSTVTREQYVIGTVYPLALLNLNL